jgi:hypothetical protein
MGDRSWPFSEAQSVRLSVYRKKPFTGILSKDIVHKELHVAFVKKCLKGHSAAKHDFIGLVTRRELTAYANCQFAHV